MSLTLLRSAGGSVTLPNAPSLLVSRENGGNLVVHPPRPVWERSELTAAELTHFAFLVSATGRAMIDVLPQLAGGCVNYWEAGNWALNDDAEPKGRKDARSYRQMHLHLLGRSPTATDPSWKWGESPRFPAFSERDSWSARFERLTPDECSATISRADALLRTSYAVSARQIAPWSRCERCGYPTLVATDRAPHLCEECLA